MDKQQVNKRMLEFQQETIFPESSLPKDFRTWVYDALLHTNPVATKISIQDFSKLTDKTEYSLYDLGYILHALEIRTAYEMNMPLNEYCQYIAEVERIVKEWRDIVAPQQDALQKEFEALSAIEQPNSGRVIDMKPN